MSESQETFGIPLHIRLNVSASINDIQAIKANLDNVVACQGFGASLARHLAYDPQFGEPPLMRVTRIQAGLERLEKSAQNEKSVDWQGYIASLGGLPDFDQYKHWARKSGILV